MTATRQCSPPQKGMVLVIVLWIIVLLSVMAASHSRNVHITTRQTSLQMQLAQARASASAGARRAIMELLAQGNANPWPANGQVQSVDILGTEVSISIRNATGLVDLNNASPDLLRAVLATSGADQGERLALLGAILDWRDVDSLTRLNGAEDDAYAAAQLGWSARDGAFSSVDELRFVLGMSDQYFYRLAPMVTVFSGRGGVNLEYAPPDLILALTQEVVMPAGNTNSEQPFAGRRSGGARAGTFHINVEARSMDGTSVASLETVVRIAPAATQPFTILFWREPMRFHFPVAG